MAFLFLGRTGMVKWLLYGIKDGALGLFVTFLAPKRDLRKGSERRVGEKIAICLQIVISEH